MLHSATSLTPDNATLRALRHRSTSRTRDGSDKTPTEWKRLLVKEGKFVADFMTGKITLEQGSKVGAIGLAPYADSFIAALTQVPLLYQDEMSAEDVEAYRKYVSEFRAELGV